jgi:hypothetical protein
MKLKTAGTIDKFQIINRRGQPVLQTGKRTGNYVDYHGTVEEEDQVGEKSQGVDDGPWTTVGRKGKKIPAPANISSQQATTNGHQEGDGATALPPTWIQLTEKDFTELPTAKKDAPPQPQQMQQIVPRNNQRQQQLNDINLKLQQLSATAPPVNSGVDQQRPLGARNKNVQRNNSRGSSRNNSRRTS